MKKLLRKFARWLSPITEKDVEEFFDAKTAGPLKDWIYIGRYRVFTNKTAK